MTRCLFAIAAWCCLHSAPAAALAVNGSFTGIAHVTRQGAEPRGGADTPVAGTFELQIPTRPWNDAPGIPPPSGRITFDLNGEHFQFLAGPDQPDHPGAVSVAGAPMQSVSFLTSYQPRFDGAIVTFASRDHLMFEGEDFSTLAIDRRTVSSMSASFASSRAGLTASVDVRAFQLGTQPPPVSEPPWWALLLTGVAGIVIWRWRALRQAKVR